MVGRTWALDIHKVRVWRLHKSLELVSLLFGFLGGVKKIDGERLSRDRYYTIGATDIVENAYHDYEERWKGGLYTTDSVDR